MLCARLVAIVRLVRLILLYAIVFEKQIVVFESSESNESNGVLSRLIVCGRGA